MIKEFSQAWFHHSLRMSEHLSRSTRSPDIVDATNTTRLIKKIEEKEAIVEYLQNRVEWLQS